jgi:hypothetical protein
MSSGADGGAPTGNRNALPHGRPAGHAPRLAVVQGRGTFWRSRQALGNGRAGERGGDLQIGAGR